MKEERQPSLGGQDNTAIAEESYKSEKSEEREKSEGENPSKTEIGEILKAIDWGRNTPAHGELFQMECDQAYAYLEQLRKKREEQKAALEAVKNTIQTQKDILEKKFHDWEEYEKWTRERIGTIAFSASSSIPAQARICNGASLSKSSYPLLFAKIGTTFGGSGDTFCLPNLTGDKRFIRAGSTSQLGQKTTSQLPDATGAFSGYVYSKYSTLDNPTGVFYQTAEDLGNDEGNNGPEGGEKMSDFRFSLSKQVRTNSEGKVLPKYMFLIPIIWVE